MTYLVFMAGTLAVLGDGLQGLANQVHVALINVKAKQAQASCGAPTNTVQELKSLTYQIIVGLVVLVAQEVLKAQKKKKKKRMNQQFQLKQLDLERLEMNPVPVNLSCGSHRAAVGNGELAS